MAVRYPRLVFRDRLRAEIDRGRPLVMTGAGSGICAKFIERGGVDVIGVYNTGYYRMQGLGSLAGMLPIADANALVFEMARREVLPMVREVPVVLGVNGVDPLRDMSLYLEDCRRIGISGVHNFPTVAWFDGEFRRTLEATGLGYEHEIALLKKARDLDLLTVGYAFNAEDTERLVRECRARRLHFPRRDHRRRRHGRCRPAVARRDGLALLRTLRDSAADQARRHLARSRRGHR